VVRSTQDGNTWPQHNSRGPESPPRSRSLYTRDEMSFDYFDIHGIHTERNVRGKGSKLDEHYLLGLIDDCRRYIDDDLPTMLR